MFHAMRAEKYRVTKEKFPNTPDELCSLPEDGPNGMFSLPIPVRPGSQGFLQVIASNDGGWEHLSVHTLIVGPDGSEKTFDPIWPHMHEVKLLFWDNEDVVVQFHPPQDLYLQYPATTLHLWRQIGTTFPVPPLEIV